MLNLNTLLNKIENTINEYEIFCNREVYVAFSGGKDSTFLCFALKALGYKVIGVTIDIGYNLEWNVLKRNAQKLGINIVLVTPESLKLEKSAPSIYNQIIHGLSCIKAFSSYANRTETICTPCYNSKMLILNYWAKINGVSQIAFAHHGSDAIASLLKSFFYYYDYMYCGHKCFSYSDFFKLVETMHIKIVQNNNEETWKEFINKLSTLSFKKVIGTDEPPKKYIGNSQVEIVRPLFGVFESDIRNYFSELDQTYTFEKSECMISGYREVATLTPREMMQHFFTDHLDLNRLADLLSVVKLGLDQGGHLLYDVRNNRNLILGNYKTPKDDIFKAKL